MAFAPPTVKPKKAPPRATKGPLPAYDSQTERKSTNFWDCTPHGPIETQTPKSDSYYQVQKGDTLFGIVSEAFGVEAGKQRLALAQVINEHPCNHKYHTTDLPDGDKSLFFGSRISFRPRFADSVGAQLNSDDGGKGHSYPIIRIPPETWGDGGDSETGASVSPKDHELIHPSCRNWTSPDRDTPCDVTAALESYWSAAGKAVSQAFASVPRPDTAKTVPNEDSAFAFKQHFKIAPDEYHEKRELLVEIRSKFAAINSFFQGAPVHFECGTLVGKNHDPCDGDIASTFNRMVVLCPEALEIMIEGKAPPSAKFVGDKQDFALTLVHEVAHLVMMASRGERYRFEPDYGQMTAEQRSMNPDSYASFVNLAHTGGLSTQHPKPKCG